MSGEPYRRMFVGAPPAWALRSAKPYWQQLYDLVGMPLRMALLPDHVNERLHLTSLRAERLAAVLPHIEGRLVDIGAGDNMLVKLHEERRKPVDASREVSIGVDVVDWGGGCTIVDGCEHLPFDDASFDTASFVACLNHIPERAAALREAHRVLRPGGKLLITMIGTLVGKVGHAIWWYSEDKHREMAEGEVMGMSSRHVGELVSAAGFPPPERHRFLYGLNTLYLARKRS